MVKAAGFYQFPVNQGSFGRMGIPDDVLCARGLFISIEYKAHMRWYEKTLSARQSLPTMRQCVEMAAIRDAGGYPLVVDMYGLPLLQELIESIKASVGYPERFRQVFNTPLLWNWTPEHYARFLKRDPEVTCTDVPAGHIPFVRIANEPDITIID